MTPSQADILLRIAEDTAADGEDVSANMVAARQKCIQHAQRILADEERLIQAWELNQREKERFGQYMPIRQGQAQGRAALGTTLAQQRAALGVIKDEQGERQQQARADGKGA